MMVHLAFVGVTIKKDNGSMGWRVVSGACVLPIPALLAILI